MRVYWFASSFVLIGVSLVWSAGAAGSAASGDSVDSRAKATESKMTDAERFSLLHGIFAVPFPIPGMPPLTIPEGIKPTAGYVKGVPRLGIPDLVESDASLGVVNPLQMRKNDVATALPSGLAIAASFDQKMALRAGTVIGSEARAKGINVQLAGGANLARDPRNGRNFEYLGEDPLLAGLLAGASIRGIQSQGVVSTLKHFALNDQETLRNTLDARIEESALRESDLLAFEIALEQGQPGSVMCSYNQVNGAYACGNDFLLNKVLKGDWGFKGWVMSDWGAVHDVSYFAKGLDQQSGSQLDKEVWFNAPLQAEVAAGSVQKARVADAVRRILRSLYAVGADRPGAETEIDYVSHANVARDLAAEGIVLLKNEAILPLSANTKTVLVIGGHADIGVISGGGSSQVTPYGGAPTLIHMGGAGLMGPLMNQLVMPSSPLKALQAAMPHAAIDYNSGYDSDSAAALAAHSDIAIVFATQWLSEGFDSGSMRLPEGQDELIRKVAHANRNTIVVLETGNPVEMPWLADVKAVLEAWYPGQEGGSAIADVLTGTVNPSGRLPMTFPTNEQQNPRPQLPGLGLPDGSALSVSYVEGSEVGYRWFASKNIAPLFPFGYGLSFTTFANSGLKVASAKTLEASVNVKNTGGKPGATVTQIYLVESAGRTKKRLVAFSRQELSPGESRDVKLNIDTRLLANWNNVKNQWQVGPGKYVLAVGDSADSLGERCEIQLRARSIKP